MTGIAPRRNQHALRAVSRRTPTPVLLPLLRACSFRLVNDAFAPRFRWDLARSLRYFLRLLSPSFGIASSPVANSQPKRHQEIDGQAEGSNRRIRSKGVASLANEVRRAMMCRSRDAQASSHNNDSLLVPQQLFRGADWRWHGSLPECAPVPNEHRTVTPYNISLSLLLPISDEMITACSSSFSFALGCAS